MLAVRLDQLLDVLGAERRFAGARRNFDERYRRDHSRGRRSWDLTAYWSEGKAFDSMRILFRCARGTVERDHHQVQVHRERVHHNDFAGKRADQTRGGLRQNLVIRHPGIAARGSAPRRRTLPSPAVPARCRRALISAANRANGRRDRCSRRRRTSWECESDHDKRRAGRAAVMPAAKSFGRFQI